MKIFLFFISMLLTSEFIQAATPNQINEIEVTTDKLGTDFHFNKNSPAKHFYENKVLNVTGVIQGIRVEEGKTLIQFTGVEAILRSSMDSEAATYRPQQEIKLVCVLDKHPKSWIRISDCRSKVGEPNNQPPLDISIAQYHSDYDENPVAANFKYKDKVLRVTGRVFAVGRLVDKRYFVSLNDDGGFQWAVKAILAPNFAHYVGGYRKGQDLELYCIGGQEKIGEMNQTVLRQCHGPL